LGAVALEPRERPPIDRQELPGTVLVRIEIVELREAVPDRVADLPVTLRKRLHDGVGETDVVAIVGARHPEPHQLRSVLLEQPLRIGRISQRLGHLPAFAVDEKPCVSTARYGALPRVPMPIIKADMNQPRCWSEPSR